MLNNKIDLKSLSVEELTELSNLIVKERRDRKQDALEKFRKRMECLLSELVESDIDLVFEDTDGNRIYLDQVLTSDGEIVLR